MAIATEAEVFAKTVADLLDRFNGIPPNRILLRPPPGTATEADVLPALDGPKKRCCELVDGVLVEKAMGYWKSVLAGFLGDHLRAFVRKNKLGNVSGEQGLLQLKTGLVRAPDVAFTSRARLKNERRKGGSIPHAVPELVVEVWSPSNSRGEIERKRRDYFESGVSLLWEVWLDDRKVRVQEFDSEPRMLESKDHFDGGTVLPGLKISIEEMFAELDEELDG